jgi:predicted transcriptional regulator
MSTNVLLSKDYACDIVNNYSEIVNQVDEIIAQTGYKGKFIAKKLGLPESSFYQKKRKKTFNVQEMKQLIALMDDDIYDDTELEFAYFEKDIKARQNEPLTPLRDVIAEFMDGEKL